DMAQLFPLAHIVLPKTPPYSLTGDLTHGGDEWKFAGFRGRMGDSDLGGDISIHTDPTPPVMEARFTSDRLDFNDLPGRVGKPPGTGKGETASEEEKMQAAKEKAEKRIFPDKAIDLERLHAMNLHATLDAKHIETQRVPIDDLSLNATMQNGVLDVKPAKF